MHCRVALVQTGPHPQTPVPLQVSEKSGVEVQHSEVMTFPPEASQEAMSCARRPELPAPPRCQSAAVGHLAVAPIDQVPVKYAEYALSPLLSGEPSGEVDEQPASHRYRSRCYTRNRRQYRRLPSEPSAGTLNGCEASVTLWMLPLAWRAAINWAREPACPRCCSKTTRPSR
jgi:hypothetical protein